MRVVVLLSLVLFMLPTLLPAQERSERETHSRSLEKRYDDLRDQLYEIKYDLREELRDQELRLRAQEDVIGRLQLKIKDLESDLFQTTQSLRNLELEVWDLKEDQPR